MSPHPYLLQVAETKKKLRVKVVCLELVWANRRSPTVWQSIANIFLFYLFMVGVTSLILPKVHKLVQTLLGKVVNCVLKL